MNNLKGIEWATSPEKRAMDVVLSVPMLAAGAPVIAGLSALVKAVEGYPPIYRQERIGRGLSKILVRKIRTLPPTTPTTAGMGHNDPRASKFTQRLRRMGLDELPQLWSVVTGDMSLIGPRPFLVVEYEEAMDVLSEDDRKDFQQTLKFLKPGLWNDTAIQSRLTETPIDDVRERVATAVDYFHNATFENDVHTILDVAKLILPRSSNVKTNASGE